MNLEALFRLVKDDPNKPSHWKLIIHQFMVIQAVVNLTLEGIRYATRCRLRMIWSVC